MSGRTMVRCSVGIGYFSFFVDFLAAVFLAAVFFAAGLDSLVAAAFLAAFFAGAFAAGLSADFFAAFTGACSFPANGANVVPSAPASTSTTSDHRMWYVEASE